MRAPPAKGIEIMTRMYGLGTLLGLLTTTACGDDSTQAGDTEGTTSTTGAPTTTTAVDTTLTGPATDTTTATTATDGMTTTGLDSTSSDSGPPPMPADFLVRIENISDGSIRPTPVSPGVWFEQDPRAMGDGPIFSENFPEPGEGLEALAEDGDPSTLAAALMNNAGLLQSGTFTTPVGATDPAPIMPGEMYEVTFTAQPFSRLGLASMFVWSNDMIIASGESGVSLFNNNGEPRPARDITDLLRIWDVGTEVNQAPGMGPDQAPLQAAADTGAPEEPGAVTTFSDTTRAVPLAGAMLEVSVAEASGVFTITLTNVSEDRGALVTGLSPMFWALHDDSFSLFAAGAPAADGLEALAEDGDPTELQTNLGGAAGVGTAGVTAAPIAPGESAELMLTPEMTAPYLSFTTMVGQTNDAFIAPLPSGIALLDDQGQPRSAGDIEDDFVRMLGVWDAGTEANQVPGVGPDQAPRQAAANTGAADSDTNVRLYADPTNDLAGEAAGGFLSVEIVNGAGQDDAFDVTITNTSDTTVYPGVSTPLVYAIHDDTISMFEEGAAASPGLEELAEDGDPSGLLGELQGMGGVLSAAVVDTPDGAANPGPLAPGDAYVFTISGVNSTERYLNFASMVVPSNDTFVAFDPLGVALFDDNGPLTDEQIATNVAAALQAWDAGTEANQAGAAGRDQAPQQAAPNTGADEGTGTVRMSTTDPVWIYPDLTTIVRVTVEPVQ